jgi:tetratricopeptide (TPR) repeat protein
MSRHQRRGDARKSSGDGNLPDPVSAATLYQSGLAHLQAGQYLDAQLCCQRALEMDRDHADTLHLMGLLSRLAGQYDLAVEWIARAIRQDPRPDYLSSLGETLERQGRHAEALKVFDKAVQLRPDDAGLWKNLGNILLKLERPTDALLSFQHVLRLDPRDWDAANLAALLLYPLWRFEEALVCFTRCDELRPNHAATLYMRALSLRSLKRFDESLADNRRAHALDPANADTCNNIGDLLQQLGRFEEALEWFDRALKLRPDFVLALINKAFTLGEVRRFDEAVTVFRHVRRIDPDNAEMDWNVALIQLLTGDFEAGWPGREARWKVASLSSTAGYPKFPQPMWLGEGTIEGKTILVYADEGLGDTIQFVRYAPMLAALGARIILVVDDAVYPLLSTLPGVAQSFPKSAGTLPAFDMHCPICSLPLALRTTLETIPAPSSVLPTPADRRQIWEDRLGHHGKLRVGLVWSGNPKHRNDHNRSIPLRTLCRILDVDATFVSLQKDARPDDAAVLRERTDIIDMTADLTDFSETAALVSCLDLIITVDTSVAHLAGALGRPTWLLLPYKPDWRWLLDRDDSPWYPTVRLFRQTATRDYGEVVDRVRAELVGLVVENSQQMRRPS